MALLNDAKRSQAARDLQDLQNQLQAALAQIKSIRANIAALKERMKQETDVFTSDDVKDVEDVLAKIDNDIAAVK